MARWPPGPTQDITRHPDAVPAADGRGQLITEFDARGTHRSVEMTSRRAFPDIAAHGATRQIEGMPMVALKTTVFAPQLLVQATSSPQITICRQIPQDDKRQYFTPARNLTADKSTFDQIL